MAKENPTTGEEQSHTPELIFRCGKCKSLNKKPLHVVMLSKVTTVATPEGPYAAITGKWMGLCNECYKIANSDGHAPTVVRGFHYEKKEAPASEPKPERLSRKPRRRAKSITGDGGTEESSPVTTGPSEEVRADPSQVANRTRRTRPKAVQ